MTTEPYSPSFETGFESTAPISTPELDAARQEFLAALDAVSEAKDAFLAAGGSFAEVVPLVMSKIGG